MEQFENMLRNIKADMNEEELVNEFKNIATKLMSEYAIKKGDDLYQMVEIEFYWYSPDHPDLSVYPRKSKAGNWFLHPSGVDITLESCVDEDISMLQLRKNWENAKKNQENAKKNQENAKKNQENAKKNQENQNLVYSKSFYGGILIRTLRKLTPNNDPADMDSFIVGPWNCSDALFDYLPCDGNTDAVKFMLPIIEKKNIDEIMPNLRDGLPDDYIGQALRSGIDENHTAKFHNKPYCFYVNKQYVRGWEKGTFPNKPWNSRKVDFNESSK